MDFTPSSNEVLYYTVKIRIGRKKKKRKKEKLECFYLLQEEVIWKQYGHKQTNVVLSWTKEIVTLKTISPDTVFCFVSYMYVLPQGSLTTMDVQKGILSTCFF